MKRVLWLLGSLAAAGGFTAGDASALLGSCKERASYSSPWRPNGRSFEDCRAYNQQRDGDYVLDERGLVWWDSRP